MLLGMKLIVKVISREDGGRPFGPFDVYLYLFLYLYMKNNRIYMYI
jgi:hypothetical protein